MASEPVFSRVVGLKGFATVFGLAPRPTLVQGGVQPQLRTCVSELALRGRRLHRSGERPPTEVSGGEQVPHGEQVEGLRDTVQPSRCRRRRRTAWLRLGEEVNCSREEHGGFPGGATNRKSRLITRTREAVDLVVGAAVSPACHEAL